MKDVSFVSQDKTLKLLEKASWIYTQNFVAEHLGVSREEVNRWLKGHIQVPKSYQLILDTLLPKRPKHYDNSDFTFIDLFAGIGGIRRGFETHGGECLYTSEWDKYAQRTYAANHFMDLNEEISGDITQIDPADIPDHDVLLAGFPCQPFSIAGVSKKNALGIAHGFECKTQGTLFFNVAKILEAKKPKAFMLENVKNLLSHDRGRTFEVIRRTLKEELGYQISVRVIDAKSFVPQHRERIFIVGFKDKNAFSLDDLVVPDRMSGPKMKTVLHPEDGSEQPKERFTFGKDAKVIDKYTLSDKLWNYLQAYAAKHKAAGNGFGFGLVGPDDVSRTLSARYYKDGSEILVSRGPRSNPRRLTPRECARLMGWEDQFIIPVSDTQAYKQFGNSVVVPVISEVARIMKPHIMKNKAFVETPEIKKAGW